MDKKKETIDEFIIFFEENQFDSKNVKDYLIKLRLKIILKNILGLLLIILAIAIIVIPLPHSLEIATLVHFDYNNGFTVSDLAALFILLFGLILLLKDRIYFTNILK